MVDPFIVEDSHVLTPEAFDFVLNNELKRAARSQNFLTLLLIEPAMPSTDGERTRLVREIARLISREVRETDLLSQSDTGRLSVVLLDSDLQNSMRVVDRLLSRLEHYEFPTPLALEMGAACCPTHGADAESLRRAAEVRPVQSRRGPRGSASNAQ
jgi:PleD family two-component response regulator